MAFADHLERLRPGAAHDDVAPARVPIEQLMPGFRVRRIAPAAAGEPWIYATNGAAAAVGDDEDGAEYVVLSATEDPVLVEMLAAVASVNADPQRRLGVGSILALRRPWMGTSRAQSLLVLPPYVLGPGLEVYAPPGAQRRIVVLWLVPVTSSEARFVRLNGAQAFEGLMQSSAVNVVDPGRAPIV